MRSTKYPQIPTTRSQLTTTVVLAIVFVIFIYFFNPDGHLPPDWKRYLTRAGGVLIMLGCVFRAKLDTHSTANWTPIPGETGHPFQRKLDSLTRPEKA